MTTTITNKGAFRLTQTAVGSLTLKAVVFGGTTTGVHDKDLNTLADLDAVTSVTLGTERLALASVTATEDDTNDRVNIDAANAVFAIQAGYTALGWCVVHEVSAADSGRELLYVDDTNFGAGKSLDGGLTVTITDFLRLVPQSA
jgi:hypothetical protein